MRALAEAGRPVVAAELRELGRIVANPNRLPFDQVIAKYETHLHAALARKLVLLVKRLVRTADQLEQFRPRPARTAKRTAK